jgi:hypothetical protein
MKLFCKCIKDGYMDDGDIFCREGDVYPFNNNRMGSYPIAVYDIIADDEALHEMDQKFFNEYFVRVDPEFFDERDFEIIL